MIVLELPDQADDVFPLRAGGWVVVGSSGVFQLLPSRVAWWRCDKDWKIVASACDGQTVYALARFKTTVFSALLTVTRDKRDILSRTHRGGQRLSLCRDCVFVHSDSSYDTVRLPSRTVLSVITNPNNRVGRFDTPAGPLDVIANDRCFYILDGRKPLYKAPTSRRGEEVVYSPAADKIAHFADLGGVVDRTRVIVASPSCASDTRTFPLPLNTNFFLFDRAGDLLVHGRGDTVSRLGLAGTPWRYKFGDGPYAAGRLRRHHLDVSHDNLVCCLLTSRGKRAVFFDAE